MELLTSLERPVNSALVTAINAVTEHFNHTSATHDGELGVTRDKVKGATIITLPLGSALFKFFEIFKKGEGTHDTPILLMDTARLLAKQMAVLDSEAAQLFVEDLYRVGYLMEYGIQPDPSTLSTLTTPSEIDPTESLSLFDSICLQPLTHEGQEYENELALWMIGRGDPSTQGYWTRLEKRNRKEMSLTQQLTLEERNKGRGDIADQPLVFPDTDIFDTKALLAQRAEVLRITSKIQTDRLARQNTFSQNFYDLLLSTFVHQLEMNAKTSATCTDHPPSPTQQGIERVVDSVATTRTMRIPYDNATTNIKDNLQVPPTDRLQYISDELKSAFGASPEYDQFNAAFTDSAKLFDVVGKLSETEAWKTRATIEKVRDIWDIVQAYEQKITRSPKLAIQSRAFECALKTYISGHLIREYIPEAQIECWQNDGHAKLMIQCDDTIYSYDTNASKMNGFIRSSGVTDYSHILDARELGLDPLSEVAGRRFFATGIDQHGVLPGAEGYHLISDFDKGAFASILGNVADLITDIPTRRTIRQRVIELTPNDPTACNNLAIIIEDPKEKRRLYRTAIELNPNYAAAYNNLACCTEDLDKREKYLRKAIELDPKFAEAHSNLAVQIPDISEKIEHFHTALTLKPALRIYLLRYTNNTPDTNAELKAALNRLLAEFP